ncbi:MAG: biosynthetic arginine decarboxylase [Desulfovibrionaceae bacterium]|nr:biosynthetic arginine decarboxylase [Desulfovibrionaceae bacterium]
MPEGKQELSNISSSLHSWRVEDSVELYGLHAWGAGYFDANEKGEVVICPYGTEGPRVSIPDIIEGIKARGYNMPCLLRCENILDSQIASLHESFSKAIRSLGYKGNYRGVFPIKVNQQQQVIEEIADFGSRYHHGLEVGSKGELIAAVAYISDREACVICNGYKDGEFIDLGLQAQRLGLNVIFVIEMPGELETLIERSRLLGIRPKLGVRCKLSMRASGHWAESGGERSVFGLSPAEIVDIIDRLKEEDMLDCMRLLHYHLGSQISNIRDIRLGAMEGARFYAGLVEEGCPMGYLDLGGGLAVDYDGSHTNYFSSRNYTMDEYAMDIVEAIMATLDESGIAHPHIVTESGRATVAYYSMLLFNILDVSKIEPMQLPETLDDDTPEPVKNLREVLASIAPRTLQECYNDAIYYRDEMRQLFATGVVNLRQRCLSERFFWTILLRIAEEKEHLKTIPRDLYDIDTTTADIYYGNFSIFQSLPDSWAIDQLFPIMPVHRLKEKPVRRGIISDITCDSDGQINHFIDQTGNKRTLELHPVHDGEEYYLGVFLVGAYQETLGDLHNLMGDNNVVSIRIEEDGSYEFVREQEGDTVADVLSYVEYEPKRVMESLRSMAERAVREGRITPSQRFAFLQTFEDGLRGYTYFER